MKLVTCFLATGHNYDGIDGQTHNHSGKMIWKCQLSVETQVSFLSLVAIISFLSVLFSCFVLCCIKRKCTAHKMRGQDTSRNKCAHEYQQPLARARALGFTACLRCCRSEAVASSVCVLICRGLRSLWQTSLKPSCGLPVGLVS